ncbi:peroxisomal fatty acid beta-oxidation multifunctional protein [Carex littledalei]|uniref:Peroxisomal fatty acid beta-oxidation multifunctional protein n=1 Tax=Carex littledalei TaxID=544730 RepID=A0A833VDF4_9POAL|nr:peroxisomal fatty acid beta-oxidation multifunctional protein [Carex littledalei]
MSGVRVTMEVGSDGVALITITNPPVNALHPKIIAGLKETYTEAMKRPDVKAIVLTGSGGKFSGGFDINVFKQIHETGNMSLLPDVSVELVVNIMEDAKKPSVAAIQGLALGGGLEMAMGCHARISTPEAQLGLPELTLGVIPGFGGTQRLPRLVGLAKATEMMLLSKTIRAKEGKQYGLIDELVSPSDIIKISRQWALDIAEGRKPWLSSLRRTDKLGSLAEAREILKAARQQVKRQFPNMPQHQACLDSIEEGVVAGGYAGVLKEAKLFKELVLADTSKGLVHVFLAQRATSKEVDPKFLERGVKMISGNLEGLVKKGSLTQDRAKKTLSLLKGVLDYSDFKDVDMVIEAVIEKIPLKQSIFADLERVCPSHCILASNTSTIDLNIVGEKTRSRDRIIGAHFFSPAHIMPLLEIVRTEKTSPQVIVDLMTVGKIIKKVPVVVGNCTGFAVNRTFFPYTQSSHLLVHLGVDVFRIDRVITSFGMPMGPFLLQDVAGYGVAMAVKGIYAEAFKGRTFESDLVELMVKDGRQGKANGKGYYFYEKGSKPRPDPSVQVVIEESKKRANLLRGGKAITVSDQDIVEMIFFPTINEACRVMDEGVVSKASDLDISSVLGMGFPKYRGGLVFWADTVGANYIYSKLSKWAEVYGGFFTPCSYLEERAKKGVPLSSMSSSSSHVSKARL